MLFASGDHAAAAELMLGALELAPGWALGWFRMGEMHEAAGALDQAAEAWRMAQKLDPDDRAGAALKLELIGRAPASDAPPGAFVEALFDQYAPTFDKALVEKLDYRVPELLFEAIAQDRASALRACRRSRLRHRPDGRAAAAVGRPARRLRYLGGDAAEGRGQGHL